MANSNIQMRSLNGEVLYPKTIMDNVEGLNDKFEEMDTTLTKRMDEKDEILKKEILSKIIVDNDSILEGKNITIDDYTGWANKEGYIYYTSDKETKLIQSNLSIYKNNNKKLELVEGASGEIIISSECECECCDCECKCGDYVLHISGTISGYFLKKQFEDKEVINANDFKGATTTTDGEAGVVPKATKDDVAKLLAGDGTWVPGITFDEI